MGGFSIFHDLIFLVILALILIVPFWKIFPRAGLPAAASILMIVPLLNIVLVWVLAFKRWPGDA